MTQLKWLLLILLCFSSLAYAQVHLRFQVLGINDEEMLKNVESRLNVAKEAYGKELTESDIQTLFRQGAQEIRDAIAPYGFFKAEIEPKLTQTKDDWVAQFSIDLGPPMLIGRVAVQLTGPGKDNEALQQYVKNFPLQKGEVLQTQAYERVKEELFQLANDQGYIKANLTKSNILINVEDNRADVIIHFDTGELHYFGSVTVEKSAYSPAFLGRFIRFKAGEPFSSQKLIEFQQELASSFYFQQVVVVPDFDNAVGNTVPIRIIVAPPKSQRYSIGVGYGTFTKFRLTAGMSLRRLTATGQHFDAQLKLSSVLSGIAGKYYIPGQNPLTDQWIIGANWQKFTPESGSSRSQTLSFGYNRKNKKTQTNVSLNYLFERYSIKPDPKLRSELLYPSINWSYIDVDDLISPHSGRSLNVILQGASSNVLSSTSFLQAEIKGKYLVSPFSFGRLIMRGDVGYTVVHSIKDLPLSMRFFAGGTNSIRGYEDSSIGPGRYLYVGSLEYQNKLYGNWTGALFYDIGTATNHWKSKLYRSQGLGLIYESMIGPVRLYVAHASDPLPHKKSLGFEFSIGPEF